MEDLQGMASMFFANSKCECEFVLLVVDIIIDRNALHKLRHNARVVHMRRSFNLFTTAVRRSKRMGGISARMKQATGESRPSLPLRLQHVSQDLFYVHTKHIRAGAAAQVHGGLRTEQVGVTDGMYAVPSNFG